MAFEGIFARRPAPADQYVAVLMREPSDEDVDWLASVAADGDRDRARWELRYLRRSLGLLVAQRDALDDRTGSRVAHQLRGAMKADRQVAAPMIKLSERQFDERMSAYREMLGLRGGNDTPAERTGRTFLLLSGAARAGGSESKRASAIASRILEEASEALRSAFGEARLPGAGPG